MTDQERWLTVCREAADAVARELAALPTRLEREPVVGDGEGGDETTAIDAAAEHTVVARLERLHREGVDFTLVSEELGGRRFGAGADDIYVVLDPIDGSMNAKRGIPFFSVSIAVAGGPTMNDVFLGFVRDFGTNEEWTGCRGNGAFLNGQPLEGPGPKAGVEILALEATTTERVAAAAPAMVGFAERTRVMGSLALSLCHLAAGRVDAVCSLKPTRSVDIAAAQLLVRERGFAIDLPESGFVDAPLDLAARSRVVAAADGEICARLFAALGE
ncbi:MAG: hypothetical protein E6G67_08610 [Actinobacteria bacterium]|nr:MAG: hypothetical protein E6G67_08610 [Actinomycetota bacterium]